MTLNMEAKFRHHKTLCDRTNDIYIDKNTCYKDTFAKMIKKRGYGYAIDKLTEKVTRAEALLVDNASPQIGETVDDTLFDIADYALMLLTEVHAEKGQVKGYEGGKD